MYLTPVPFWWLSLGFQRSHQVSQIHTNILSAPKKSGNKRCSNKFVDLCIISDSFISRQHCPLWESFTIFWGGLTTKSLII